MTINHNIWSSVQMEDKCPHCGVPVLIEPKDVFWQMGIRRLNADGTTKSNFKGGMKTHCPKCEQSFFLNVSYNFSKDNSENSEVQG